MNIIIKCTIFCHGYISHWSENWAECEHMRRVSYSSLSLQQQYIRVDGILCNLRKLCNQFVFAIILILGKQTNKKTIVSPNYMNWDINPNIVYILRLFELCASKRLLPQIHTHTHTRAGTHILRELRARLSRQSRAQRVWRNRSAGPEGVM